MKISRAIESVIVAKIGKAIAEVDKNDDTQWADILPDCSVKVSQKLYNVPFLRGPITDDDRFGG